MHRILIVDDEKQILRSLERLFIVDDYEVKLKESARAALDYLKEESVDLIISDIRMASMDGFELLRTVKAQHPDIIRVALSGYTESHQIYKALNENLIKLYLFKPWDNTYLKDMINQLFALEEQLKDKRILSIINNLGDLPTLPKIYYKVIEMINSDEDVGKIAQVLDNDQSMTCRILRISNSAYYGAKTSSVSQAILYIGLSNIRAIMLGSTLIEYAGKHKAYLSKVWAIANLTNRFTSLFYMHFLKRRIPQIFESAGLLHNIGLVVFVTQFETQYNQVLVALASGETTQNELEVEHLGITHQELGGILLNWWEMPVPVVEAALYHLNPLHPNVINVELLEILFIARWMARMQLGEKEESSIDILETCCNRLNLKVEEVQAFYTQLDLNSTEIE